MLKTYHADGSMSILRAAPLRRVSTLQRLSSKLAGQALAEALGAHFGPVALPLPVAPGSQGAGYRWQGTAGPVAAPAGRQPCDMLTAFCHEQGVVLAQELIEQAGRPG